jgi:peptidoglycan/xylan/chitin deacetylase (PgdA/CDA1 family)
MVSFTFDDFPRSALVVGGSLLRTYGMHGTFYTSMGLMNTVGTVGPYFTPEDLQILLSDGHELGSHTFSHVSSRSVTLAEFQADVRKGRQAVEQLTHNRDEHHFSYPFGHATLCGKRSIGVSVSSCRGIVPGVNASPVDLNLLRANCLYSRSFDREVLDNLFRLNDRQRGWLIFYTHDLSDVPSAFGCRPSELESVVRTAIKWHTKILTVRQALRRRPVAPHCSV